MTPPAESFREWRDLAAMGLVIVLAALSAGNVLALSVPFGAAAILLVPGYALIAAVFPTEAHIDFVERLALSLGTSLAMVSIQAFALDTFAGGIGAGAIRFGVSTVALALLAVAGWRRAKLPSARIWAAPGATQRQALRAVRFTQAMVVANVLMAALAFALTIGAPPPAATEFYVLGREGSLSAYPRSARTGEQVTVSLGVRQGTAGGGQYSVSVLRAGEELASLGAIALRAGGEWRANVGFAVEAPGPDQEITIVLLRDGDSQPYRTLRLWLDVAAPGDA